MLNMKHALTLTPLLVNFFSASHIARIFPSCWKKANVSGVTNHEYGKANNHVLVQRSHQWYEVSLSYLSVY